MVRFSGFVVLALTCVCAPRMASACWDSAACSNLSSKERMLVRGLSRCLHFFRVCGGIETHAHTCNHTNAGWISCFYLNERVFVK